MRENKHSQHESENTIYHHRIKIDYRISRYDYNITSIVMNVNYGYVSSRVERYFGFRHDDFHRGK
jgi:hypothetical protein